MGIAWATSQSHHDHICQPDNNGQLVVSMAGTARTTRNNIVETAVSNAGTDDANSSTERVDEPDEEEPQEDEL